MVDKQCKFAQNLPNTFQALNLLQYAQHWHNWPCASKYDSWQSYSLVVNKNQLSHKKCFSRGTELILSSEDNQGERNWLGRQNFKLLLLLSFVGFGSWSSWFTTEYGVWWLGILPAFRQLLLHSVSNYKHFKKWLHWIQYMNMTWFQTYSW